MKKKVVQIRDVNFIEDTLITCRTGVLAYNNGKDKVTQIVSAFLYENKNIYLVFDEDEEKYEQIKSGDRVSFIVFKELPITEDNGYSLAYKRLDVRITGIIKKNEDSKLLETISHIYRKKYFTSDISIPEQDISGKKLIMIDTEEIQSAEITGGL